MNPINRWSPFLNTLVEDGTLSPKVAERFNQLGSLQLQQQAADEWAEFMEHAADDLCATLEEPRVLYDSRSVQAPDDVRQNLQPTALGDASDSGTPSDELSAVLRKHFDRFEGHHVFRGFLIILWLTFIWGGVSKVFAVVAAPIMWSWQTFRQP